MITDIILYNFIDLDQISSTATFQCDPDLDLSKQTVESILILWILDHQVNGQGKLGTLPVKPCGHNTDNSFTQSLPNFPCKLFMIRGETLLIFSFRVPLRHCL